MMEVYDDVFNPLYFLFICALAVIYYDSKKTGRLYAGILTAFLAYGVGYSIYSIWLLIQPAPQWIEDGLAVSGLLIATSIGAVAYTKEIYDGVVRDAIFIVIALSVPYVLISRFWDISGHVAYTAAPVLYLIMLDRRLAPLISIPIVMVVNRPIVGAHTIEQSIAGFALALIVVFGYVAVKRKLYVEGRGVIECS